MLSRLKYTQQIKKTEMARHIARMGERRRAYTALVEKPEWKNHLEDPGVDGRITLK